MSQTTQRLLQAATCIAQFTGTIVQGIEYVDNTSENDFKYRMKGLWNFSTDDAWFEITWQEICNNLGYNPDNLCTTTQAVEDKEFSEIMTKAFQLMKRKELKDKMRILDQAK